jgi:hypothetical protein
MWRRRHAPLQSNTAARRSLCRAVSFESHAWNQALTGGVPDLWQYFGLEAGTAAERGFSRYADPLGKISPEFPWAKETFFFPPRYCRGRKDDPT